MPGLELLSTDPSLADRYRALGAWRDRTVLADLRDRAEERPDDIAIVTRYAASGEETQVSYGELYAASVRLAATFAERGVRPGEVVSFQLPNWWQFTCAYFACIRAGVVANPILPIMRGREVAQILRRVGSRVLIVPGRFRNHDYLAMARELRRDLPGLEALIAVGGETAGADVLDFAEAVAGEAPASVLPSWEDLPTADDLAVVKFTSGTTGEPKGVMHTHNTLFATTLTVPAMLGLGAEDVVFMASPLTHMSGFLYGVLMPVTWGMKVVYLDAWNGTAMAQAVQRHRATWTMGATTYATDFLDALDSGAYDVSSFRAFSCSGAPVPRSLPARCAQYGFDLRPTWGMTETGAVTYTAMTDDPRKADSTDGRPSAWMQIRIVDERCRPLPPGEEGRLLVRGASRFVGYYERPDLTAAAVDAEGWLDTGDLGVMDAEGYLRISGRLKDIVVRGGENVPVVEVENLLRSHPRVADVAVVGYPDQRLGERVLAVVVPRTGAHPDSIPGDEAGDRRHGDEGAAEPVSPDALTLPDVLAHLAEHGMAKHYWPERLELVDALPRTDSGKVQKFVLRQRYAEEGR